VDAAVASYRRAAELDVSLAPAVGKALASLERAASRQRCLLTLQGHQGAIYDAAAHPQAVALGDVTSRLIATAGADASLRLWCSATGRQLQQLRGHSDRVTRLHWSACGSQLASASSDGTSRLWRLDACCLLLSPGHVLRGHGGRVSCLAFSPCGSQLATGSGEGQVWQWSTADGSCQQKLSGHGSLVTAVCFSPCATLLASASGGAFVLAALLA
jgi:WD40 repeat protein